jgi:hypothetical protein
MNAGMWWASQGTDVLRWCAMLMMLPKICSDIRSWHHRWASMFPLLRRPQWEKALVKLPTCSTTYPLLYINPTLLTITCRHVNGPFPLKLNTVWTHFSHWISIQVALKILQVLGRTSGIISPDPFHAATHILLIHAVYRVLHIIKTIKWLLRAWILFMVEIKKIDIWQYANKLAQYISSVIYDLIINCEVLYFHA